MRCLGWMGEKRGDYYSGVSGLIGSIQHRQFTGLGISRSKITAPQRLHWHFFIGTGKSPLYSVKYDHSLHRCPKYLQTCLLIQSMNFIAAHTGGSRLFGLVIKRTASKYRSGSHNFFKSFSRLAAYGGRHLVQSKSSGILNSIASHLLRG